jgi:hypothetical protein
MRSFTYMKSFISVILSLIYFSLSSTAMVNMHYCGGELESIKIYSEPINCCCGDSEMTNSCCQDEEIILELDIDQQLIQFSDIIPDKVFIFSDISFNTDVIYADEIEKSVLKNYKIPPPKLTPIWIVNCSFTFYG